MKSLSVLFVPILAAFGLASVIAAETREVKIQPGEHWWAGVIAEAHHMPFTAESRYEFDFFADTAGNQGQPLLISDQGRYIWCDEPFRFEFDRGVIRLRADSRSLHRGANGSSAATAFQAASRSFFPASGRMPDPLLFTRPQFNTWIELTTAVAGLTNPYGTYGVDRFKFDGGGAEHYSTKQMLTRGRAFQANTTRNEHSELYARVGLDYPLNEYRACWKMGGMALAQHLRDKNHTWTDLQKLIPGMLVSGLMGYLHEAALAANPPSKAKYDPEGDGSKLTDLGVHEHWNNAQEMKYSHNLGKKDGIDLLRTGTL